MLEDFEIEILNGYNYVIERSIKDFNDLSKIKNEIYFSYSFESYLDSEGLIQEVIIFNFT